MHIERIAPLKLRSEANMTGTWIFAALVGIFTACVFIVSWFTFSESSGRNDMFLAYGPMAMLLGYCLYLHFCPTIIATFDRQEQQFVLEKKWIWGNQIKEYPLSAIKGVHVIRKGRTAKAYKYHKIKLEMHSFRFIPLSSQNYFPKANVQLWAKELIDFLFNEPRLMKPSPPELHVDAGFPPE